MSIAAYQGVCPMCRHDHSEPVTALASGSGDHAELARLAEAATPGPWDRMAGRGLVRAIRDDLAVPLFEPLEPYSDPMLDAPTWRVGGEVVFRANSQAARESAAIRQSVHNAAFIAAASPATVLALLAENAALRAERDTAKSAVEAWAHVCESLEAHLQDRVAMQDVANPERYLSILRSNIARVQKDSEQIRAARWAGYRRHETRATEAERKLAEAVRLLRRIDRTYADMQDGNGNHPTELRKVRTFLSKEAERG